MLVILVVVLVVGVLTLVVEVLPRVVVVIDIRVHLLDRWLVLVHRLAHRLTHRLTHWLTHLLTIGSLCWHSWLPIDNLRLKILSRLILIVKPTVVRAGATAPPTVIRLMVHHHFFSVFHEIVVVIYGTAVAAGATTDAQNAAEDESSGDRASDNPSADHAVVTDYSALFSRAAHATHNAAKSTSVVAVALAVPVSRTVWHAADRNTADRHHDDGGNTDTAISTVATVAAIAAIATVATRSAVASVRTVGAGSVAAAS